MRYLVWIGQFNINMLFLPLQKCLEVYDSSKVHSGATHVGENGVGLKQACATLSDRSFVLVKNEKKKLVELGIIAEELQSSEGV